MELTTAMLADGVQQVPPGTGKLYILGGQWDRLTVPNFPVQHPTMAVVIVVRVEYSEAIDPHRVDVALTLDGKESGPRISAQMVTGHAPGTSRGAPSFVSLPITVNNLVFQAPGRYEWVISVDEKEIGRLPMEVVQGGLPGIAPRVVQPPPSESQS